MLLSVEPFDVVERISEGMDFLLFDCGNPDFNDFIKNEALTACPDKTDVSSRRKKLPW